MQDIFKIIGLPTRRKILRLLASGEYKVGDLVSILKEKQSTISMHLAMLRACGLVKVRAVHKEHWYSLEVENWNKTKMEIEEFLFSAGLPVVRRRDTI